MCAEYAGGKPFQSGTKDCRWNPTEGYFESSAWSWSGWKRVDVVTVPFVRNLKRDKVTGQYFRTGRGPDGNRVFNPSSWSLEDHFFFGGQRFQKVDRRYVNDSGIRFIPFAGFVGDGDSHQGAVTGQAAPKSGQGLLGFQGKIPEPSELATEAVQLVHSHQPSAEGAMWPSAEASAEVITTLKDLRVFFSAEETSLEQLIADVDAISSALLPYFQETRTSVVPLALLPFVHLLSDCRVHFPTYHATLKVIAGCVAAAGKLAGEVMLQDSSRGAGFGSTALADIHAACVANTNLAQCLFDATARLVWQNDRGSKPETALEGTEHMFGLLALTLIHGCVRHLRGDSADPPVEPGSVMPVSPHSDQDNLLGRRPMSWPAKLRTAAKACPVGPAHVLSGSLSLCRAVGWSPPVEALLSFAVDSQLPTIQAVHWPQPKAMAAVRALHWLCTHADVLEVAAMCSEHELQRLLQPILKPLLGGLYVTPRIEAVVETLNALSDLLSSEPTTAAAGAGHAPPRFQLSPIDMANLHSSLVPILMRILLKLVTSKPDNAWGYIQDMESHMKPAVSAAWSSALGAELARESEASRVLLLNMTAAQFVDVTLPEEHRANLTLAWLRSTAASLRNHRVWRDAANGVRLEGSIRQLSEELLPVLRSAVATSPLSTTDGQLSIQSLLEAVFHGLCAPQHHLYERAQDNAWKRDVPVALTFVLFLCLHLDGDTAYPAPDLASFQLFLANMLWHVDPTEGLIDFVRSQGRLGLDRKLVQVLSISEADTARTARTHQLPSIYVAACRGIAAALAAARPSTEAAASLRLAGLFVPGTKLALPACALTLCLGGELLSALEPLDCNALLQMPELGNLVHMFQDFVPTCERAGRTDLTSVRYESPARQAGGGGGGGGAARDAMPLSWEVERHVICLREKLIPAVQNLAAGHLERSVVTELKRYPKRVQVLESLLRLSTSLRRAQVVVDVRDALSQFEKSEQAAVEAVSAIQAVAGMLAGKGLVSRTSLPAPLSQEDLEQLPLPHLREHRSLLEESMGLDVDTLRVLRRLCPMNGNLFQSFFNKSLRSFRGTPQPPTGADLIAKATTGAIGGLTTLVAAADSTLEDLLQSGAVDLLGDGALQAQSGAGMDGELQVIASLLVEDGGGAAGLAAGITLKDLTDSLTAGSALLGYRRHAKGCVNALQLTEVLTPEGLEAVQDVLVAVQGNPKLSECFALLGTVQVALEHMRPADLAVVEALHGVEPFLKMLREMDPDAFTSRFEFARRAAVDNPHIQQLLQELPPVRELLTDLIGMPALLTEVEAALAEHGPEEGGEALQQTFGPVHILANTVGTAVDMSVTAAHGQGARVGPALMGSESPLLEQLQRVAANWGIISGALDAVQNSSNNLMLVVGPMLANGCFVCYLGAAVGGARVELEYTHDGTEEVVTLTQDQLESNHVSAQLNVDSESIPESNRHQLELFHEAFELAMQCQEQVLLLEAAGHPNFQHDAPEWCPKLNSPCHSGEALVACLTGRLSELRSQHEAWNDALARALQTCPSLCCLPPHGLTRVVQCLLTSSVFGGSTSAPATAAALLPHALLCHTPAECADHDKCEGALQGALVATEEEPTPENALRFMARCMVAAFPRRGPFEQADEQRGGRVLLEHFSPAVVNKRVFLNQVTADGQAVHPAQVLVCDPSTSAHLVAWWMQRVQCDAPSLEAAYVIGVDQVQPAVRDELAQLVASARLTVTLTCIFTSSVGWDQFASLQDLSEEWQRLQPVGQAIVHGAHWMLRGDSGCDTALHVVGGPIGQGKSHFLRNKVLAGHDATMHIHVHEGFSAQLLMERYARAVSGLQQGSSLAMYFAVSEEADCELLSRCWQDMLSFGILFDWQSGAAHKLKSGIRMTFAIELPAIAAKREHPAWPLGRQTDLRSHPLFERLGVLHIVGCKGVFVDSSTHPLVLSDNMRLTAVAMGMLLCVRGGAGLGDASMLLFSDLASQVNQNQWPQLELDASKEGSPFTDAVLLEALLGGIRVLADSSLRALAWTQTEADRLVRTDVSRATLVLFCDAVASRMRRAAAMQAHIQRVRSDVENSTERQLWLWTARPAHVQAYGAGSAALAANMPHFWLFFLETIVQEAAQCAGNPSVDEEPFRFFTSAPEHAIDSFRIAVTQNLRPSSPIPDRVGGGPGVSVTHPMVLQLDQSHEGTRKFSAHAMGQLRRDLAEMLGLRDTGRLVKLMQEEGFVVTPFSAAQLLAVHQKCLLGQHAILMGDTGVGKTFLVRLYSALRNCDESLYFNTKALLVAIIRRLTETHLHKLVRDYHAADSAEGRESVVRQLLAMRSLGDLTDATYEVDAQSGAESISSIPKVPTEGVALRVTHRITFAMRASDVTQAVVRAVNRDTENLGPCIGVSFAAALHSAMSQFPLHRQALSEEVAAKIQACVEWFQAGGLPGVNLQNVFDHVPGTVVDLSKCLPRAAASPKSAGGAAVDPASGQAGAGKAAAGAADAAVEQCPVDGSFMRDLMTGVLEAKPVSLFRRILMHDGMTADVWRRFVSQLIRETEVVAQGIRESRASAGAGGSADDEDLGFITCVFVDELNTANALHMVSEAFTNHSMDGVPLPRNIFFIGAINPRDDHYREGRVQTQIDTTQWAHAADASLPGHVGSIAEVQEYLPFVVRHLPAPLQRCLMPAPDLTSSVEEAFLTAFVQERMDWNVAAFVGHAEPDKVEELVKRFKPFAVSMMQVAHTSVKGYRLDRVHLSIRDMVRCCNILSWLLSLRIHPVHAANHTLDRSKLENPFLPAEAQVQLDNPESLTRHLWAALQVAVGAAYWLRLPGEGHTGQDKKPLPNMRELFEQDVEDAVREMRPSAFVPNWWERPVLADRGMPFRQCMRRAVEHLFSKVDAHDCPQGLARTQPLLENFFATALSVNVEPSLSVLISGPPGCGKTLAVALAAASLRGKSSKSKTFHQLRNMVCIHYQCSQTTSVQDIVELYRNANRQQRLVVGNDQARDRIMIIIDEAGLPSERKQVMKAAHDALEDATGPPTIMLSNLVLDAAKTNRCLHVSHTSASTSDMVLLCCNLLLNKADFVAVRSLLDTGTGAGSAVGGGQAAAEGVDPEVHPRQLEIVKGLMGAFNHILRKEDPSCRAFPWFHMRDMVYFCRHLRHLLDTEPLHLLRPSVLIQAIRRNFQTVERTSATGAEFAAVVRVFMEGSFDSQSPCGCGFELAPQGGEIDPLRNYTEEDLRADSLSALKASVEDHFRGNPSDAHFRHTLVVDRSNCEAGLELMYAEGVLKGDPEATMVVSLSEFRDDHSLGHIARALREVKKAAESGKTLVLRNCPQPIYTALYDLFNRYYNTASSSSGTIYFANLTIGALSVPVKVHPAFKVVVHVSLEQLRSMPAPLLNRFSKFVLSGCEAYTQQLAALNEQEVHCFAALGDRQELRAVFFKALMEGVEDFADKISSGHPALAFYGYEPQETVPALVMRAIRDARSSGEQMSLREPLRIRPAAPDQRFQGEQEEVPESGTPEGIASVFAMLPWAIRRLNCQLMQMLKPAHFLAARSILDKEYTAEYIEHQEHFSGAEVLKHFLHRQPAAQVSEGNGGVNDQPHVMVFTRHSSGVGQLQEPLAAQKLLGVPRVLVLDPELGEAAFESLEHEAGGAAGQVGSAAGTVCTLSLGSCLSSAAVRSVIGSFFAFAATCDEGLPLPSLLISANTEACTASQINVAREAVTKCSKACRGEGRLCPPVVILSHAPPQESTLGAAFHHIPTGDGWESVFVDAVDAVNAESEECEVVSDEVAHSWLCIGVGSSDTVPLAVLQAELGPLVQQALRSAARRVDFHARALFGKRDDALRDMGLVHTAHIYNPSSDKRVSVGAVEAVLEERPCLVEALMRVFSQQWGALLPRLLSSTAQVIRQDQSSPSLLSTVRDHLRSLFVYTLQNLLRMLAGQFGFEALSLIPQGMSLEQVMAHDSVEVENGLRRAQIAVHGLYMLASVEQKRLAQAPRPGVGISVKGTHVPKTPLYTFLAKELQAAVDATLSKGGHLPLLGQVRVAENLLERNPHLATALMLVCSSQELHDEWLGDFFAMELGFNLSSLDPAVSGMFQQRLNAQLARALAEVGSEHGSAGRSCPPLAPVIVPFLLRSAIQQAGTEFLALIEACRSTMPLSELQAMCDETDLSASDDASKLHAVLLQRSLDAIVEGFDTLTLSGVPEDETGEEWVRAVCTLRKSLLQSGASAAKALYDGSGRGLNKALVVTIASEVLRRVAMSKWYVVAAAMGTARRHQKGAVDHMRTLVTMVHAAGQIDAAAAQDALAASLIWLLPASDVCTGPEAMAALVSGICRVQCTHAKCDLLGTFESAEPLSASAQAQLITGMLRHDFLRRSFVTFVDTALHEKLSECTFLPSAVQVCLSKQVLSLVDGPPEQEVLDTASPEGRLMEVVCAAYMQVAEEELARAALSSEGDRLRRLAGKLRQLGRAGRTSPSAIAEQAAWSILFETTLGRLAGKQPEAEALNEIEVQDEARSLHAHVGWAAMCMASAAGAARDRLAVLQSSTTRMRDLSLHQWSCEALAVRNAAAPVNVEQQCFQLIRNPVSDEAMHAVHQAVGLNLLRSFKALTRVHRGMNEVLETVLPRDVRRCLLAFLESKAGESRAEAGSEAATGAAAGGVDARAGEADVAKALLALLASDTAGTLPLTRHIPAMLNLYTWTRQHGAPLYSVDEAMEVPMVEVVENPALSDEVRAMGAQYLTEFIDAWDELQATLLVYNPVCGHDTDG